MTSLAPLKAIERVLAIDPGIIGGWAILGADGSLIACDDLPVSGATKQRMVDAPILAMTISHFAPSFAMIENVNAMPKQGVASSFKFGRAVGVAEGVVGALGIPVEWVHPTVWKKHFRLSSDKEQARQLAIRRFPSQAAEHFSRKKDHGRAEACLIALYHIETSANLARAEA